jgi:formate-dependent nitrite reductase cytochrome c552 subunit
MWRTRLGRDDHVTCVACGRSIVRSDAREYDKEGNRWSRTGKKFEHVCKNCHRDLNHQPRNDLEELLIDVECSTPMTQEEFVRRYNQRVEERYGSLEK